LNALPRSNCLSFKTFSRWSSGRRRFQRRGGQGGL